MFVLNCTNYRAVSGTYMLKRVPQLKEQFSFSICSGSDRSELMLLEVPLERVTIMEELGQGAFGRVHKSVMRDLPKKNKSSKLGNHLDTQQGRIVATKVLHGE